ncbi:hypothetical protein FN846DRAFT_906029 [Sphaerosporella brunnea]|uniref:Uncharacterized protein n=1 Tax=Sphaerosporella brunnea TaxID=1250544 RepID=A0A5J5EZD6_9PEZI|nr:hypothetical protein FN846DRAFT_906029 [Sphaerosporella brunnea]
MSGLATPASEATSSKKPRCRHKPEPKPKRKPNLPLSLEPSRWKNGHLVLLRIELQFTRSCYHPPGWPDQAPQIDEDVKNPDAYNDLLAAMLSHANSGALPGPSVPSWCRDLSTIRHFLTTMSRCDSDTMYSASRESTVLVSGVLSFLMMDVLRTKPGMALQLSDGNVFYDRQNWRHRLLSLVAPKPAYSGVAPILLSLARYESAPAQESLSRNPAADSCQHSLLTAHGRRVYLLQMGISREALDARRAVIDDMGKMRPLDFKEMLVVTVKGRWDLNTGEGRWRLVITLADLLREFGSN